MGGIIKNLLQITRIKKKKSSKIGKLARSKLNSIETLTTKALIDYEISHEEYQSIINEEEKYRKMKEDTKMMKSQKSDELNNKGRSNEISKINRENNENA